MKRIKEIEDFNRSNVEQYDVVKGELETAKSNRDEVQFASRNPISNHYNFRSKTWSPHTTYRPYSTTSSRRQKPNSWSTISKSGREKFKLLNKKI